MNNGNANNLFFSSITPKETGNGHNNIEKGCELFFY